ncbi:MULTISPECIES: helix-turn-helix domain-containing protein [Bacillus cereus group]|uniref:Transcriptional regulator, XRE family n=1 Tax=Bacillus mycoides (strain KBAB4) TaxID=315730 RepID=A9VH79_BACMK|nr:MULTISPECIES: helix-turn-helix transcriptional regulator [Bacillus cereus group]ABY42074.1 transcriptional regulator, XRE family [Bacillus mycoides KBAB4]OBW48588.1 transcriptional regulator [Bacillus cereus]
MELTTKLGERIRFLRKEKNLSQERLGELSGIHTNHIGAIERGEKNVTLESLAKVTKGLDITLEELFRYLQPMDKLDDLNTIMELLLSRTSEDHALVLHLIKNVFDWEAQKHN